MTMLLLILGLLAGLIAGLFGVGGGIIFTPVLFFLLEQGDKLVIKELLLPYF